MEENKEKVLTDKIIEEAQAKAAALIKSAEEEAAKHLSRVKASAAADRESAAAEARAQAKGLIEHRMSLSGLEIKREELKARRNAVDNVFADAVKRMCERDGDEYVSIVSRMIKKHGQDGDVVLRGRGDEKRITKETVADIAKAMKIKLGLSDGVGDFTGGVMLIGKHSDKNLTFDSIFGALREDIEPEIARILFKQADKNN